MATPDPVTNPLHKYASWTYNFSLWWLDIADYNNLVDQKSASASTTLLPNSYVLAEQGGIYTDRRLPATYGLNYNIQDVEFTTIIGLNAQSKSTNLTEGKITIIEPYGVSLLDTLISASWDPASQTYQNYNDRPYMLELDFVGWTDEGKVPDKTIQIFKKRFPIRFTSFKLEITTKGSVYNIGFTAAGHEAYDKHTITTPKIFSITAGTVDEFFNDLSKQWTAHLVNQVMRGQAEWADEIVFEFPDDIIGKSKITSDKQTSISDANTNMATKLDTSKKTFTIPAGTSIIDIISKALAQSEYLQGQLNLLNTPTKQDQTQVLSAFKTSARVKYQGMNKSGVRAPGVFDVLANRRPKQATFVITPYASWNNNHPRNTTQLADPSVNVSKVYNYTYTGKNIDILDLKVNFDSTYFIPVLGYLNKKASVDATASTARETLASAAPDILFGQGFFLKNYPQLFGQTKNPTPLMTRIITNDRNITMGMKNSKTPEAQTTADVVGSLFTRLSGDMMTPEIRIVGDPTLIKQDDWLYVSNSKDDYNSPTTATQAEYVQKTGHVKMDAGDVVCSLKINSPIDIDTDITNQGGIFPPPGTSPSTFDGYYRILIVRNIFTNGKFEQVLRMTRYANGKIIDEYNADKQATEDAVNNSQNNQDKSAGTNTVSLNSGNREEPGPGTFFQPTATTVVTPQYSQTLDANALPNGVQART